MSNSKLICYTKLSPNCNKPRNHKIDTITIHHMAGNCTIETCGNIFASSSRQASSNYGVGTDGRIALYVDEANRSWCSSSSSNDHRAVTIEVANDGGAPNWHVSDKALAATIDLCVDICQRNGIAKLNYTGDKTGNLTMHKWFAATACPGPYLESKFPYIAEQVNKRLGGTSSPSAKPSTTTVTGTASTGSAADEKAIWNYLLGKIGNEYGVAGLMGNLFAESALKSNNLQNTYEKKLGYTDAAYTAAVDNGSYTNFIRDSAGYGLAQWTYWSRKQDLLEYAQSKKKSVGDLTMQLEFLYKELSESYKGVLSDLKGAASILAASNSVLTKFERPANQGESVQKKRAEYGQKYYDKYAKGASSAGSAATSPKPSAPAATSTSLKFKVGDVVNFTGSKHYTSANAASGVAVKASKAKITAVSAKGKHPYHCRAVNASGAFVSGVYGWVDASDVSAEAGTTSPADWTPAVGDTVTFKGTVHYTNANAAKGSPCRGGKAKITRIFQLGKSKHPYHLVRIVGGGSSVYGWVDAGTFTKA